MLMKLYSAWQSSEKNWFEDGGESCLLKKPTYAYIVNYNLFYKFHGATGNHNYLI